MEYVPGRRSTILYWPLASVTTDRTFSISAELAASTVTPGNTAPDVSLTTPASACAASSLGRRTKPTITRANPSLRINDLLHACETRRARKNVQREGTYARRCVSSRYIPQPGTNSRQRRSNEPGAGRVPALNGLPAVCRGLVGPRTAQNVLHRVVAFVAGVLEELVLRVQFQRQCDRPRPCPRLRVGNGGFVLK